jgi:hypothetical protein
MTTIKYLQSYGIQVNTKDDLFVIPVVDVRDGEERRGQADNILYASNATKGSKYLRPSFAGWGGCYQNSHKQK